MFNLGRHSQLGNERWLGCDVIVAYANLEVFLVSGFVRQFEFWDTFEDVMFSAWLGRAAPPGHASVPC